MYNTPETEFDPYSNNPVFMTFGIVVAFSMHPAVSNFMAEQDALIENKEPFEKIISSAAQHLAAPLRELIDSHGRQALIQDGATLHQTLSTMHMMPASVGVSKMKLAVNPSSIRSSLESFFMEPDFERALKSHQSKKEEFNTASERNSLGKTDNPYDAFPPRLRAYIQRLWASIGGRPVRSNDLTKKWSAEALAQREVQLSARFPLDAVTEEIGQFFDRLNDTRTFIILSHIIADKTTPEQWSTFTELAADTLVSWLEKEKENGNPDLIAQHENNAKKLIAEMRILANIIEDSLVERGLIPDQPVWKTPAKKPVLQLTYAGSSGTEPQ